MDYLKSLWATVHVNDMECCQCGSQIGPDDVLARTFRLESQLSTEGPRRNTAQIIEIPDYGDKLVVFHRHLHCLLQSTRYVAVSHVWLKHVADVQHRRELSAMPVSKVAHEVRLVPALVCKGLTSGLDGDFEVWHDYISVPQWQEDTKTAIIRAIPQIYQQALFTTTYLPDLEAATIESMRKGSTAYERCRAISDICNCKHFSRVWTAMEFTQSRTIRFMTKEFILLKNGPDDKHLFRELWDRWNAEVVQQKTAQSTEEMVGMGYNLVPWQLGPLDLVRTQNNRGDHVPFAIAHELLARRCVTIPRDFFHALLGILKPDLTESLNTQDLLAGLLQVARSCLRKGDFSPLFMIPASAQGPVDEIKIQSYGYNDLDSFSLGGQQRGPTSCEVTFNSANNNPIVPAEYLGKVGNIIHEHWFQSREYAFEVQVRHVLAITGPDVNQFVRTIGGRLYGQDTEKIFARLSEQGRMDTLRSKLSELHTRWSDIDEIMQGQKWTFSIVLDEIFTLYAVNQSEGSSRQYTVNLAECLGNNNGRFDRGMSNFHLSATSVQLVGTNLTALLRTADGQWNSDTVDVRDLVKRSTMETDYTLAWIADALGLSNRALNSEMTPLSPMEFLASHGGTIHWGLRCALMSVRCASCAGDFLLRVAFFADRNQVNNLTAWRIPGLKYQFTLEGGAGLLLDDGRIVGRFLWASQTCDCSKLDKVEIVLNDLPVPRQNLYEYGRATHSGWLCVRQNV